MATHPDNTTGEEPREQAPPRFGSARQYDEYRVKLYKVACREARDKREQLRLDWETRQREQD